MFVSLIKKSLETSNENYFKQLYFYQDKANKRTKNFTFSVRLKDYELIEDQFKVNGQVDLFISSPDQEWMIYFYNGLLKLNRFEYRQFCLTKQSVYMLKEPDVTRTYLLCKTMSPIYIKDKNGQALSPYDQSYANEFLYISDLTLTNYRGVGLQSSLRFVPIEMKKNIIKEPITKFQEQTQKPYLLIEGYKGTFLLEGHPEDLRDLYQLGVGFRRSSGWGMLEVIDR
jgi:CRISPR-associated endoribonuclease Cas6